MDTAASSVNKEKRLGNVLKENCNLHLVVALDLVPTLEAKWGLKLVVKTTLTGGELENCRYVHPIESRECPVVIGGDYITTESGTGLVHTAPGHGQEDYVTGLKYGLPVFSPVDDGGKFTEEAGQFNGLDVLGDGNLAVIECLDDNLSMIMVEPYSKLYFHFLNNLSFPIISKGRWFFSLISYLCSNFSPVYFHELKIVI